MDEILRSEETPESCVLFTTKQIGHNLFQNSDKLSGEML